MKYLFHFSTSNCLKGSEYPTAYPKDTIVYSAFHLIGLHNYPKPKTKSL